MSRIGKKPIAIPAGVEVKLDGTVITVKGAKGTLTRNLHPNISVEIDGAVINVSRPNDEKLNRSRSHKNSHQQHGYRRKRRLQEGT